MSAAAPPISRPPTLGGARRRVTLADRLRGAWSELAAEGVTVCPCCAGRMESRAAEGRCRDCGTRLA